MHAPPLAVQCAGSSQDERGTVAGQQSACRPHDRRVLEEGDNEFDQGAGRETDENLRHREPEAEHRLAQHLKRHQHRGYVHSGVADAGEDDRVLPAEQTNRRAPIDLQLSRPDSEQLTVATSNLRLEAIILDSKAYFRGQRFLSAHMGSDLLSLSFVKAAGNGWWKGSAGRVPRLTDLTDGNVFRSTFLGQAITQRTDHVSVDGIDAVDLSGARGEVFITAQAPYRVLRVRLRPGVVVDGIRDADLRFVNYNRDLHIAAPAEVIDFSNLSTLPPIYTVVSVDTSRCGTPCAVSALLKNLGGLLHAKAPSTIIFTMTDTASRQVLGSCQTPVLPDVAYNATTMVTCSIENVTAEQSNAATVTAKPDDARRA